MSVERVGEAKGALPATPTEVDGRVPGSGQYAWRMGAFEHKARRCRKLADEAIEFAAAEFEYTSRQIWRKIFGTVYPD
jgi:hypothetical protein